MTHPSPSPVTDDGLVERFRANILVSSNIRGGALNHFEDYEIRAIIRAALAASDRDVLVGRIAGAREALQACLMLIDNAEFAYAADMDVSAVAALAHAALIPLAGEL